MAEYIEREKALEILERSMNFSKTELDKGEFQKGCIAAIKDDISNIKHMPSADVAPRAEVAREIFEEIEREITDALKSNYKVLPQIELSKALWNNVNGKINALRGIVYFMEELKKKYTDATDRNVGHK